MTFKGNDYSNGNDLVYPTLMSNPNCLFMLNTNL